MSEYLKCIACGAEYSLNELRYQCDCGGLLSVERDMKQLQSISTKDLDQRLLSRKAHDISGVWRFREGIIPFDEDKLVSQPEGQTRLYRRKGISSWANIDRFFLKHEGENPSGSFKDRGMTTAITQAKKLGADTVACASTGNTSASLAMYAAHAGMNAIVFLPDGKVASGKLAQALAYGAKCLAIKGDFDQAMAFVKRLAMDGKVYLANSLNPFRVEGQKSIIWEIFQNLEWKAPDWIVVPGGNLGNTSAFGKAIREAYEAGWIQKKPRLATIQAGGANPFFQAYQNNFEKLTAMEAETVATAIRIGNPVNYEKAKREIQELDGIVISVSDEEILAAKKIIDSQGIGCEPASACSLAGAKNLVQGGIIKPSETVVGILTGHLLKDTDNIDKENQPIPVDGNYQDILKAISS
ncbi:MAG: threonine synthase [Pseudobacteriovorax sp.]|nr:threonine synthase [Pseudobacteriovorax sp.]